MTEAEENLIFQRINAKHWNYDNWQKSERPDFLVKVNSKTIGIEFTEVIKKYYGEIIAQKYRLEDKLAQKVTQQLNQSSMDLNLHGIIDFKDEIYIYQNEIDSFCHRITSSIITHSRSLSKESWSINHYIDKFIPEEVNWISYDCYPFLDKSEFYASRSKTQEFLDKEDVIDAIKKKELKYEDYFENCDEVHLIIVEGLLPASWIGKLEKPLKITHSYFESIFLFHFMDSEFVKLK